jgi:toxin ParE1/3/4
MRWNYRFSRVAEREMQDIADYWTGRADSDVAVPLLTDIVKTILLISRLQQAGRLVPEFGPGVRRFPSGDYLIYYRIVRTHIRVLHVIHGARDQRKAWAE